MFTCHQFTGNVRSCLIGEHLVDRPMILSVPFPRILKGGILINIQERTRKIWNVFVILSAE